MSLLSTIHIYQGATWRATFTWTDPLGKPISLAGLGARFRLLNRAGGTILLEVLSTNIVVALGTVLIEPTNLTGEVSVRLTAAQTALLKRNGVYSIDVLSLVDLTEIDNLASGPFVLTLQGGG